MMYFRLLWTVVLCAGPVVAGLAQPGGESASKVTRTIRGDTLAPGERGRVSIRARIADGWTMYAPDSPPPTIGAAVAVGAETSEAISVDRPAHTTTTPASGPHFDRTVRFFAGPSPLAARGACPSGPVWAACRRGHASVHGV
jgi:hypothetical protein